jgi:glycosyltransferase involved in cell wall biosynthesis
VTEVSVILCVRNGAATIGQQLAALTGQDYAQPWELLVVDNGSTDGTAEVLKGFSDRLPLRVIPALDRPGLAYARNVGARSAQGRILAFCDADDVADPRWLSALTAGLRDAELVGGGLELESLNTSISRLWRGAPEDPLRPPSALGYLPYAVGACFAVRRETFEAVGGCDEAFTACGDDLDLSWRIQRRGGTLEFRPGAVMHYRLRADVLGVMRQRYRYGLIEALLRRKFADAIPAVDPRARLLSVLRLLTRSWELLGGARRRGVWLVRASHLAGQLRGSIRYRVLA